MSIIKSVSHWLSVIVLLIVSIIVSNFSPRFNLYKTYNDNCPHISVPSGCTCVSLYLIFGKTLKTSLVSKTP